MAIEDKKVTKLTNVRLAFPQIFEAKSFQGEGKAMFSASFLIDPSTKEGKLTIIEIEDDLKKVATVKWGAKAEVILKSLKSADKTCFHNGDLKSEYDGFAGKYYISARSDKRPLILDRDKSALTQAEGRPYGGCYVNATVEFWPQDSSYGKRINASLRGIQFVKDGDAFAGGAPASEDEFDSVESDETDLA